MREADYKDNMEIGSLRGICGELDARVEALQQKCMDWAADNSRLRSSGQRLESTLAMIDIAVMSQAQIESDTEAVGGPVPPYSVDYDELGVLSRVSGEIATLRQVVQNVVTQIDIFDNDLPMLGTMVLRLREKLETALGKKARP